MDIKEGEYVRTKSGIIDKIYEYREDTKIYHCERKLIIDSENMLGTYIQDITNHSFEPIDLIEAGDYVNGHKVYESDDGLVIFNIDDFEYFVNPMGLDLDKYRVVLEWQDENYIKSIVTKEQFDREKYIVGG